MKNKILFFLSICILMPLIFFGQFRKIYLDSDSTNEVRNISFISPKEGFVIFDKYIGYTQDSGHTFTRKYITINNVDYNGYYVNLTFGFDLKGIHVYNKDSFLVYGDYGFVPSILLTINQGNTFKLIYNSTLQLSTLNAGVQNMVFPEHNGIGYAVETNRILKTTNNGMTWNSILNDANASYFDVNFLSNSTGFAVSGGGLVKTTNGGNSWHNIVVPQGTIQSMSFITENKGWLVINYYNNNIYYTNDGGSSWTPKGDNQLYPVGQRIKFLNDSVGYSIGGLYNIYKTTDSGKIWEPLPRNNNYSYYFYSHNALFFLDPLTIWAGGGHGFLELSTNGGGSTLPLSRFTTNLSSLNIDSKVNLINYSKTGYQYKWIKNSVQFASSYNASYTSNRQLIDTIKLIVQKGVYTDTSQIIIDTRVNTQKCFATFQAQVDTGTVKLIPGYQTIGVKHYWDFGDGVIDSTNSNPLHTYKAIGNYSIKHKVYNTIDKCRDSSTTAITVIRTQNCLAGDFTYTADSFYTNRIRLKLNFDSTKETNIYPVISWKFGDGSMGGGQINQPHVFDSSGFYDVCAIITNYFTGCVSSICKPVLVQMVDSCNANFLISTQGPATAIFNGKPNSRKTGKRNIWVINDHDSTNTGNAENFIASFFTSRYEPLFDRVNNGCGYGYVHEICIDSLNKKMTHIIYDSVSKCSDVASKTFLVPRQYAPFIKAVPDPSFPYYVSFYAYTGGGADSFPYSSVWRIQQAGGSGGYYTGNYTGATNKLTYTFSYPGHYTIAIAAQSCANYDNSSREVYYINYYVAPMECPIYPPDFTYKLFQPTDFKTINFFDWTVNQNGMNPNNSYKWYFGDGDSSIQPLHTYSSFGVYNVTLKYTNSNGCSKEVTKPVSVTPPCSINANFFVSRDAAKQSRIIFTNSTTSADSALSYKWYFGNGDSSSKKDPVYFYKIPGVYNIKLKSSYSVICESVHDTTINISANDICNLVAGFTQNVIDNVVNFKNITSPSSSVSAYNWDFGDGNKDTSASPVHKYNNAGTYLVCLSAFRDSVCSSNFCDSVVITALGNQNIKVIPNPVSSSFIVQYISDFAESITIEIINASGTVVMSLNQQCVAGLNKYNLNADNLQKGYYIMRIIGASGKKSSASFLKM